MKLYLDTSVYGGYYDDEFEEDTRMLFDTINSNKVEVITSIIVLKELEPARKNVREVIDLLHGHHLFDISQKVLDLANDYISDEVVSKGSYTDAMHIAIATINQADIVVSWNMKHMVSRKNHFNEVNLRKGYQAINIYTPTKILNDYEKI